MENQETVETIDGKEIQNILNQIYNNSEGLVCCEKIKKWVHDHTGTSQQYVNGQPTCFGNGGCGPCAGIGCFLSIDLNNGGNNGELTTEQLSAGLRTFRFAIIELSSTEELKVMVEFNNYLDDFIKDGYLLIPDDITLSESFVSDLDYNHISIDAGNYPVFYDENTGFYQTVLNSEVN